LSLCSILFLVTPDSLQQNIKKNKEKEEKDCLFFF